MRNHARPFLLLCLIGIMGLFVVACNKSSNSIDADGNPLASVQDNARQATPEELQRLMPPEFFVDPDGDGSIGTNSLWLSAQTNLFASVPRPSLRANVGTGKTILFYTKQNTQWLNFTSDLRQLLADNGYTVLVHNANSDLPDLTNVDVLAIIHSIWAPGSPSNKMLKDDKDKIKNFVASGKGFFYSGDWLKSELPQFNDIAGIFNVTMSLQQVSYILTGFPPPTMIYVPTWSAYVFDWINYYSTNPSQPIMKKAPVFGWLAFSNETHEIFKDVDSVLFLGSSFVDPRVTASAAIRTHPTTSRPRDYPIVPEGYPMVLAKHHGAGRYVISCDSNCFANDGFAKSDLANTDNKIFAMNVFNWLAKTSTEASLKITTPADNSVFQKGDSITFVGEKVGNITNIQWSSDLEGGIISSDFPSFTTSTLRPGTHTITLSGVVGGLVASARSPAQANIRAQAPGTPVSNQIQIGVQGGKPRVTKIAFESMTGPNNWNQIYDRKGEYRQSILLEPNQWQGSEVAGEVGEDYCWPVSYVRSNANDVGNGLSKLKVKAYFKDLDSSQTLSFDVQLVGKLYENGVLKQTLNFDQKTIQTTSSDETTETFESINGLPDVVGIWSLELEWSFIRASQSVETQRTPKVGTYQAIFTTWEKPFINGYFEKDVIDSVSGLPRAEGQPALYLEILQFSCKFAAGSKTLTTEQSLTEQLLTNSWAKGSSSDPDKFVYKAGINPLTFPRGIDALLIKSPHEGVCQEWALFLKALNHSQGGNLWYKGILLTQSQKNNGFWLWDKTPAKTLVGLGDTSQPPIWKFQDHAYNSLNQTDVLDLSFNRVNPSEADHINGLFELINQGTGQTFPNPFPSDIHQFVSHQ